ncbi:hypothetical protein A2U01_0076131, partial [Trifolium medium]|nr:hypothetical protein [Trifolium medium]
MHELYVEDLGKSTIDFTAEVEKDFGTLGLEYPKSSESVPESVAVQVATITEGGQSDDADVPPNNKTDNIIDSHQKNASKSIAVEDA